MYFEWERENITLPMENLFFIASYVLYYIKYLSLYFQESIQYIQDNHWVERSFQRLNPVDFKVNKQYQTLKQIALDYIQKRSAV